jgi:hypothetical protein
MAIDRGELKKSVQMQQDNNLQMESVKSADAMRNALALSAQQEAGAAQRTQMGITADEGLKKSTAGYYDAKSAGQNADTTGQLQKNDVDLKFAGRKAEAITGDLENSAGLNKKFGDPMKTASLESLQAETQHIRNTTKAEADAIKLGKINQGGAAEVSNGAAELAARGRTQDRLTKNLQATQFEPLAYNHGSGDARDYEDTTRADQGMAPASTLDKVMRLFPGASAERAFKLRSQLRNNSNLALPK